MNMNRTEMVKKKMVQNFKNLTVNPRHAPSDFMHRDKEH